MVKETFGPNISAVQFRSVEDGWFNVIYIVELSDGRSRDYETFWLYGKGSCTKSIFL